MGKETVITANDLPPDVVEAIKGGHKIEAIKLLRMATGLGLANAKVLVDAGARLHGVQSRHPAMVDASSSSNGLLKMALLLALAFGAYQYFLNLA
jgi:hypothetical protein